MSIFEHMIHRDRAPEAANDVIDLAPVIMEARYKTVNDVMRILSNPEELQDLYAEVANDNSMEEDEALAA